MKHYLTLAAALALFASAAYALNDDVNSGNTLVNSTATQIGGSVNGSTINNGAGSGSASVSNTNTNSSYATSSTQNLNSLRQDSESSVTGSGNSANENSASVHVAAKKRNPVSTAWAAPLVAADDTCMGSTSVGGQGIGFGLSVGSTWHDEDCVRRKDARELHNMGYKPAAIALMCQNDHVRQAMATAGTPCAVPADEPEQMTDARAGSRIVSFDERLQTR